MFHLILEELLGSKNVYFQPPASVKMNYPAIVYNRAQMDTKLADDSLYGLTIGYMVTYIDSNPDSIVPNKLITLPLSRFSRHYTANNLNHSTFVIYY